MEGKWQGCILGIPALGNDSGNHAKARANIAAGKPDKVACPAESDPRWHDLNVPGHYEPQHPAWDNHNGIFWYRKVFKLPKSLPPGAEPTLIMGGVDDWDITYLNGKEIGHTNPENFFTKGSAYNTPRKYIIPFDLLKKRRECYYYAG